jgi:hypothetical protein
MTLRYRQIYAAWLANSNSRGDRWANVSCLFIYEVVLYATKDRLAKMSTPVLITAIVLLMAAGMAVRDQGYTLKALSHRRVLVGPSAADQPALLDMVGDLLHPRFCSSIQCSPRCRLWSTILRRFSAYAWLRFPSKIFSTTTRCCPSTCSFIAGAENH